MFTCCLCIFIARTIYSFIQGLLLFEGLAMVLALLVVGFVIYLTMTFLYKIVFGKEHKNDDKGYKEGWFGKEPSPLQNDDVKVSTEDTAVRPFKINVPDEILVDLNSRLDNTRFEEPVEDSLFLYGFNHTYLKEVVKYWRNQYNWRKHEEDLNRFPQFKTRIEGLDVHFLHVKPTVPEGRTVRVIPLLIIHGWPGSIVEFYKIIPLLTTPRPDRDYVFEVVCPSIPGFGFSESPHQKGFNVRAAARVFLTLMERIGHSHFYVQGGDWGSIIATLISKYYSPRVRGLHLNMYFSSPRSWDALKYCLVWLMPFLVSATEYKFIFPLKKFLHNLYEESGYFHMQSTKPDTLGCGMSDSPAGTAGYIMEKFSVCSNPEFKKLQDGGLTKKFTLDELLTNVMMYWVNNNFTAAARFYKENISDTYLQKHEKVPVTVPSAVAVFPYEVLMYPKMLMSQQLKNLVSYNIMPKGGHFAALEEPQLLADDIWQFVGLVEK